MSILDKSRRDIKIEDFDEFLAKHEVHGKNVKFNFGSLNPNKKYLIEDPIVWDLINSEVANGNFGHRSLVEQPLKNTSILRFDIDFKLKSIPKNIPERWYEPDFCQKFVHIFDLIFFEFQIKSGVCCIFEKESRCDKNDGIHIVFPELFVTQEVHKYYIEDVIKTLETEYMIEHLKNSYNSDLFDIVVDKIYGNHNWIILGSVKSLNAPKSCYKVSKIFEPTHEGWKLIREPDPKYFLPSTYSINKECKNHLKLIKTIEMSN
jgi:hypothetical protein